MPAHRGCDARLRSADRRRADVAVHDDALAALLADAAGHLGPAPGVALLSDGACACRRARAARAAPVAVTDPADLVRRGRRRVRARGRARARDRRARARPRPRRARRRPFADPSAPAATTRPASRRASPSPRASVAVLAGPGVIRTGHLDGVRAFAAAAGLGVANTWGAKGMFAVGQPAPPGTCGLQADDFALLGFGDVDLLVVTGLDPDEAPQARWALAPHAVVAPEHLDALAHLGRRTRPPARPTGSIPQLAAVVQRLSPSAQVPLSPPGPSSTSAPCCLPPGSSRPIPASRASGWRGPSRRPSRAASACPPRSRRATRRLPRSSRDSTAAPAIAVTTAPIDEMTARVLELARSLGVGFPSRAVGGRRRLPVADDHLADARTPPSTTSRVTRLTVPVDATAHRRAGGGRG